ncbi:MAG: right-handed parallel beta-helix repeat-containing protein [Deltaproteobacteria bacterium]
MHRRIFLALTALLLGAPAAWASTLEVGPGQPYAKPCDAIAAAQPGDVIEVDAAGSYDGDTCAWTTDGLTVRGIHGRAKIDLTGVTPAQQKGIFTIEGGASATIENFELSGAAISAAAGNNGAGIRHQGLNLTVRNCFIHDNQDGILGKPATTDTGTILVESSEFSHNGAGDGYSHNLYINDFASFTMQFSYSHDGNVGHLVKSRAYTTLLLYNRITDEDGGTASYEVDLPNGGTAYVIGNLIEQSATTQNPAIVSFGEEGTPSGYDSHLFVVNNTILNDLGSGTFVVDTTATPALLENDIFYNGGTVTGQVSAVLTTNFESATMGDPKFVDVASYDVDLAAGSPCIDQGSAPGSNGGQSLAPLFEYVHPLGSMPRTVVGSAIDIGAYEYGLTAAADGGPAADAGPAPADAGSTRDAGISSDAGAAPDGGVGTAAAAVSGDGGGSAKASRAASGGCGCRVGGGASHGASGEAFLLLFAALLVVRARSANLATRRA